jgi:hypothetical protein
MEDILSQGGDREPRRWPRRLAAIGAIVVVAVASIVYLSLGHRPHFPAAAPPTPVATSAAAEPDAIGGPVVPWAASLRLPVAGTQPTWFSPATGDSAPIGSLPADSAGYRFTRASGGWVVQASSAGVTGCGDCTVPSLPVWFVADGARSATRVGRANQVTPSATAGAVWLTSYPPTADPDTAARTAREVSLAGVPMGPPVRLPTGYVIYQATDRGLLLAPVRQRPGTPAYKLWNPADSKASRTFDGVIAASPTEIAWTPPCARMCRVQLLNLATGRQAVVELPAGSFAAGAAFSPSGGYLALQVMSDGDGGPSTRLEVASVASGRLTALPGTSVGSDTVVDFGWPTGGDSLVAEFVFPAKVQLASWHPGATRLAVAVIGPGQDQDSVVVG